MAEVSVLEGSSVTLLCGYSVKNHGYDTCWGRNCYYNFWGECGCSEPRVIKKAAISPNDPKKYSLSGENLTISNLQLKDRGSYCCCVDISSVFYRDYTEYYNLKVVKGKCSWFIVIAWCMYSNCEQNWGLFTLNTVNYTATCCIVDWTLASIVQVEHLNIPLDTLSL